MGTTCAWCGALLGGAPEGFFEAGHTDRICVTCTSVLEADLGVPVDRYQSESGPPVVVVTDDVRIVDANPAALDMLEGDLDSVIGRLGGQVFRCEHARPPGGCGATPACPACVVRCTVTATWKTGRPRVRVPATLRVTSHRPSKRVGFFVTTARAGNHVLLRIDSAGAGAPRERRS